MIRIFVVNRNVGIFHLTDSVHFAIGVDSAAVEAVRVMRQVLGLHEELEILKGLFAPLFPRIGNDLRRLENVIGRHALAFAPLTVVVALGDAGLTVDIRQPETDISNLHSVCKRTDEFKELIISFSMNTD